MGYSLLEQAKIRLRQYHINDDGTIEFDNLDENIIIEQLISEAWGKIKSQRYNGHSESEIEKDFAEVQKTYESVALDLVLYNYSKEGAEFEKSNTENGITRSYISENDILSKIPPLIKFL